MPENALETKKKVAWGQRANTEDAEGTEHTAAVCVGAIVQPNPPAPFQGRPAGRHCQLWRQTAVAMVQSVQLASSAFDLLDLGHLSMVGNLPPSTL